MLVGDLHDFPCAEFQRRLDGLRTLMAERDIDAALITPRLITVTLRDT